MSYYFSIFLRRLPYFLIVAVVISALAIITAVSLPPSYVSQLRLIVESPQIPDELAPSTVSTPALEQLQIFEQRLLTRANLLDIATRLNVLKDQAALNPDEIVRAMRARTQITTATGRDAASLMTISFEAPTARNAAGVLNEYLTLIQQENVEFRTGRAGQTQEFFQQEVTRLGAELDAQSTRILEFKNANTDALPESLEFRLGQQASLQERLSQVDREIFGLKEQRDALVQVFNATGRIEGVAGASVTPEQRQLDELRNRLNTALAVYSTENPQVKLLQAQVAQAEATVRAQTAQTTGTEVSPEMSMLDVQLAQIDTRIEVLQDQVTSVTAELEKLADSITRTPANAISLDALDRTYQNVQGQYNIAVDRLARASTGERIELLSRGQRIGVIEQPAVPSEPSKPNRILIAGGGSLFGIMAGLALVVLLEFFNTSARRPEDLVRKLGITPIATIPYIQTRNEIFRQRMTQVAVALLIVIGIPAALYAVHMLYQPLDLMAERLMNRFGIRW